MQQQQSNGTSLSSGSSRTDSVGQTGDSAVSPVTLQPTASVALYEKPQLKHDKHIIVFCCKRKSRLQRGPSDERHAVSRGNVTNAGCRTATFR